VNGASSDQVYVGARKGLFRLTRMNGGWRLEKPWFLGDPVSAFLRDARDGALYAALDLGHFGRKLHRSEDDGATWKEIAAPAFAPTRDGASGPSVELIWALEAGGADQPGWLWAGTVPGGLFLSKDRGESWTLVDGLWNVPERARWSGAGNDKPAIHTILIDPRDSRKIAVAISTGGVWKSADAGQSWRNVGQGLRAEYVPPELEYDLVNQDVHRLAFCAAAPERVWCQHHNGVFVSSDGAETFKEVRDVKPAVFGFGVVAHPGDAGTAWFVPGIKDQYRVPVDGKLVVTRTQDGGESFEPLSQGLPQADCYDLVYRHALAVHDAGARLAMGSTTGNLWISENGGEAWTHASAHLPPIAVVRFA
jgi:hypothetical protein